MTHLHAKPHEVRAMLDGDEFVIVRPMKRQPELSYCYTTHGQAVFHNQGLQHPIVTSPLPYSIGDAVVVKEAFAREFETVGGRYVAPNTRYRASHVWAFGWKPAQNMRPEWSRLTLTVTDVQVKRVQDVTEEEARLATGAEIVGGWFTAGRFSGMSPREVFLLHWKANNPKTPWDSNPWIVAARCRVHRCNISDI